MTYQEMQFEVIKALRNKFLGNQKAKPLIAGVVVSVTYAHINNPDEMAVIDSIIGGTEIIESHLSKVSRSRRETVRG